MAQLIVENGPQQGTAHSLQRDHPCHLGKGTDCELRIDEPGIADRHVVVKALRDEGFGVKALDGPVSINGKPVKAARLHDGDVVEIGGTRLRYAGSAAATAADRRRVLGGFELGEVLGSGGMGTVYRAEQKSLNREVALKILSKELTKDPVFVARFVAEARAAARLHHPNVVQVFDVGHDGDTYYYSMELMHEGSLEERIKKDGPLSVEDALRSLEDAARGLAYAESLRIVHCDIKPDNLMIDRHGNVKIVDLGLALTDQEDQSKVLGTPHFMSPEQALGKPLDTRSDLYSLGCTFYRLLTGKTPFRRPTVKEILRAHVKEAPEPLTKLVPEVSSDIAAIADRLLQKDPAERYQAADDLITDIESVLRPPARRGMLIAGIAVAVLVASGALIWGLTRPEGETVTEIIKERDPRVAGLLEEIKEKDAEIARLRAVTATTAASFVDRAAALERVAAEHEGTAAGDAARAAAAELRTAHERELAAAAKRAEALQAAEAALRGKVQQALERGDFRAADLLLARPDLPAELATEESLQATIVELRAALRDAAQQRLAGLRDDGARALEARDPAGLEQVIRAFENALNPDSGWPTAALDDPSRWQTLADDTRAQLASLREDMVAEERNAAWGSYVDAMLGTDRGALDRAAAFDLAGAAAAARRAAEQLGATAEPGRRAAELAASLEAAASFLQRFRDAADGEQLTYEFEQSGDPSPVLGFATNGDTPGLSVKVGPALRPRVEVVPLEQLRGPRLTSVFALPGEAADAPDRAAFLAWLTIADHLRSARRYVAEVRADQPASGLDEQAYQQNPDALVFLDDALQSANAPWSATLQREVRATTLLVTALRAFSTRRNLSAANLLERLLAERPHAMVVRALES